MGYRKPCPFDASKHLTDSFSSGSPVLDDWLKNMAGYNQSQHYTKTFVITDENDCVVGYHALCAGMIYRSDTPRKIKGAHAPDEIPVALLARMAVDRRHQGKGLGAALLRNALLLVISASQLVAFRAVVVEAADEKAKRFYEHFGFFQIKGMDMKLVLSTADILKSSVEACHDRDCC